MRLPLLILVLGVALASCTRLAGVPPIADRCLIAALPDEDWARSLPDSFRLTGRPSRLDARHAREIMPMHDSSRPVWASLTALWREGPADSLSLRFLDVDSSWLITVARGDSLLHGDIHWSLVHGETTRKSGEVTARWVSCAPGA